MKQQINTWNFTYRNELEDLLERLKISKEDICLVGSLALSYHDIRAHRDLDLALRPSLRGQLLEKHSSSISVLESGTINFNLFGEIQALKDRYKTIGILDEELIENSTLYDRIDGFKVARLEIEFSHKNCRLRKKDFRDIPMIEEFALKSNSWNWDLVRDSTHLLSHLQQLTRLNDEVNNKSIPFLLISRARNFKKRSKKILKKVAGICLHPHVSLSTAKEKYIARNIESKYSSHLSELTNKGLIFNCSLANLLAGQYDDVGQFSRMDILVRHLAIEEYFGENNIGFSLYNRMQKVRIGKNNCEENFRSLIKSFSEKGFDKYSEVLVDSFLNLIDGSHRIALSLYFGNPEISLRILPQKLPSYYGIDWFRENGFSEEEIEVIENKRLEVFYKLGIFFYVIIWPPAHLFFDEIEKDLRWNFKVINSCDLSLDEENFQLFLRQIYSIDDVSAWKVERKLNSMLPYAKKIRVISLEIPDPKFRKKAINNHPLSDVGAKLKAKYRSTYMGKIENYVYDVIIHTGDNYEHNRKIGQIIQKSVSRQIAE
ncbi:MAG: hypothetical protein QNJ46_03825 [Leptolyngbyaceae cyanobacterium MO_188.B28]|nr:hypothetical protein [Leptolyngbyaceae cyanobacterium MO_188.B28]